MDGLKQTFVQGVISRKQNKATGSKFVNSKRRADESFATRATVQEEPAQIDAAVLPVSAPVAVLDVQPATKFVCLDDLFSSDEHLFNDEKHASVSSTRFDCLNDVFRSLVADQPVFAKYVVFSASLTSLCS